MANLKRYTLINSGHKKNQFDSDSFSKHETNKDGLSGGKRKNTLCKINLSLIRVHSPTENRMDKEKEAFYDELNWVL